MPLGIDVGGTKIAYGEVQDGTITWKKSIKTPKTKQEIIDKLIEIITLYRNNHVGIGIPGQVKNGYVIFTPNIPLSETPLKTILENTTNKQIAIENDANAFLIAEHKWGIAQGYKNIIGITLGTGIGGAIIINNQIWQGSHGAGAEFGHMSLIEDGPLCGCGSRGCVEAIASPKNIERWVEEYIHNSLLTPDVSCNMKNIVKFKDQYTICRIAYDRFIRYISMAVANLVNILDPEVVVFGGSGVLSWEDWYKDAYQIYTRRVLPSLKGKIPWLRAKFLNDAGIIGAAATAYLP